MTSKEKYKNTGVYLRLLYDDLVVNLHQRLEEAGYGEITPSHGLVFQYLEDAGSRVTELAGHASMTKQSMSALVYQLEGHGYLKRKNDPLDARAVLFILTEKGQILKNKAQQINYQFEKKWEKKLGASRYRNFRQTLMDLSMPES
jgi:DNA-binding MarR family transcriptional regulator